MSKLKYSMHLKGEMGKITIIISLFFVLFLTTGLKDYIGARDQIESSYMITTAAVDKGKTPETVQVTIISQKAGDSDGQNEEKKQNYFAAEATSIFEVNRIFHTFMNQNIFWGHLDAILMSQAIAEKQLPTYLEFFVADHETRLDPLVFIVKGRRSEDIIKLVTESGNDITDLLNNLNNSVGAMSISSEVDLLKASNLIINEYNAPYIPLLRIQEDITDTEIDQNDTFISNNRDDKLQKIESEDQTKKEAAKSQVELVGYAFFNPSTYELEGFLEDYDARGFNWVTDNVSSGTITVKDSEGANITLEIINSKPKIEPKINGDFIDVTLSISMFSNIVEQQGNTNSTNKEGLNHLINQQTQAIEKEIQVAVDFATQHQLDIFDVSNALSHQHPKEWQNLESTWQEKISTIRYTIEVDSNIKRVYIFDSPLKRQVEQK